MRPMRALSIAHDLIGLLGVLALGIGFAVFGVIDGRGGMIVAGAVIALFAVIAIVFDFWPTRRRPQDFDPD